jgi:hypothetical protein
VSEKGERDRPLNKDIYLSSSTTPDFKVLEPNTTTALSDILRIIA